MNIPNHRATYFTGGDEGDWLVERIDPIVGEAMPAVARINVSNDWQDAFGSAWRLTGVSGHARYTHRNEKTELNAVQAELGRKEATLGALIPIRKSEDWWNLTQDERRDVFEAKSRHISHSLRYTKTIARKLYHCRDLGEPFDFLTWFEFPPQAEGDFNGLLAYLRSTKEWQFVTREFEVRLRKR